MSWRCSVGVLRLSSRVGLTSLGDGAQVHWTRTAALPDGAGGNGAGENGGRRPPVVLLHGGPGLPDYLGDVAGMVADLAPVYRYDQRGAGRSVWRGRHALARHVGDLAELLDAWDAPRAVLVGHSYGAELAARFCLAHPDRVAAVLLMCGPFLGDWRTGYRAERERRMTDAQRERLRVLEELPRRSEEQEVELLTLAWFTDHSDAGRGRQWAARDARRRRPVNWRMNRELGAAGRADPLDGHVDELRERLPARAELLGGCDDPRPLPALEDLARSLGLRLTRVEGAGHEPWLERPDAVRACLRRFVRDAPLA
ncbi:alpha/beta fold hydrolase [Streptomyces sp. SID335]|nr:alpha/beta fold hydrolase [Streptomyces sp. SID335]MYZ19365.1 alpha/beta fold hydrolase [Streptomyces sp. SID337]NDZ87079.1 alpha/beta hydrolase [Streptomyces sp. SID10115]NDZ99149.1 alpha/beta hydrolase [Streptomyces sp. SID10116]NEB43581.1 alpha/beta hydrolase [Streptomyces sp. SID339]